MLEIVRVGDFFCFYGWILLSKENTDESHCCFGYVIHVRAPGLVSGRFISGLIKNKQTYKRRTNKQKSQKRTNSFQKRESLRSPYLCCYSNVTLMSTNPPTPSALVGFIGILSVNPRLIETIGIWITLIFPYLEQLYIESRALCCPVIKRNQAFAWFCSHL